MEFVFKFLYHCFLICYFVVKSILFTFIPVQFRWQKDIRGQVVLITGAAGTIGRQLALAFAKRRCTVVCWDICKQENEETARVVTEFTGERAFAYQVDLQNRQAILTTAKLVKQQVGAVSILVNNAGIMVPKNLMEFSDEEIQKTFDVNILAHFWTVRNFLPEMMKQNKGHIVTMASTVAFTGIDHLAAYGSSKAAAVHFDECLRLELEAGGYDQVKTTVVCPAMVDTPLIQGINMRKLFHVLKPSFVAEEVVAGVCREDAVIVVPKWFSLIIMLKAILPIKAAEVLLFDIPGLRGIWSSS